MKKKLGILVASAALLITACQAPASSSNEQPSWEPTSSSTEDVVRVTGVTLDRNNISLKPEQYTRLVATVAPENAANKDVQWTSSNPAVAYVDLKGTVTAIKKGTATITAKTADGDKTATCTVTVEDKHEIRVVNDANIKYTVADKAEAGELVNFKAVYDQNKYVLDGIYANGEICGARNDGFYFYMPESIVTLEARYHEKPAAAVYKNISVVSEGAFLNNVPGGIAEVGAKVEFTFSFVEGLMWDGTISVKSNGQDVPVTKVNGATYSMTMPNGNVEIEVGSKAEMIPFDIQEDLVDLVDTIKVDGESWNNPYIPYGADVEIKLYGYGSGRYANYNAAGVVLADSFDLYVLDFYSMFFGDISLSDIVDDYKIQNADLDDWQTINFVMPSYHAYIDLYATPRYNDLTINSTENIEFVVLEYDEDYDEYYEADVQDGIIAGQTIYLAPVSYSATVLPKAVWVEPYVAYRNYYGSTQTQNVSKQQLVMNEDGYYVFTLDQMPKEGLIINATEKDMLAFEACGIAGEYIGFYTWGTNKAATAEKPGTVYTMTVDEGGDMNYTGDAAGLNYYSAATKMGTYTEDGSSSEYQYFYEDGVFFTNESTSFMSQVYKYVYFKIQDGDTASMYTFTYECFNNGKSLAAECYRNGELYSSFFCDYDLGIVLANPYFEMIEGASINANDARYEVYGNMMKVCTVSYKDNGGMANRGVAPYDALFGTFKHNLGKYADIFFDGLGNAYIEGVNLNAYPLVGGAANTYAFQDPETGDEYIIQVLKTLGIYKVLEYTPFVAPVLAGTSYSGEGNYYSSSSTTYASSPATYNIKFVDDTHCEVTTKYGSSNSTGISCTTASKLADQVYTLVGNKLTVKFYGKNNASTLSTWVFFVDMSGEILTGASTNARVQGSSNYFVPTTLYKDPAVL